jgi:hypothetical protein
MQAVPAGAPLQAEPQGFQWPLALSHISFVIAVPVLTFDSFLAGGVGFVVQPWVSRANAITRTIASLFMD